MLSLFINGSSAYFLSNICTIKINIVLRRFKKGFCYFEEDRYKVLRLILNCFTSLLFHALLVILQENAHLPNIPQTSHILRILKIVKIKFE